MSTDFRGKKLIHIQDVPVGCVYLYGGFSAVELDLAFLRVTYVRMWISTEKSSVLFCNQKKVVIYTVSDIKAKLGKNEIVKSKVVSFVHFEGIILQLI